MTDRTHVGRTIEEGKGKGVNRRDRTVVIVLIVVLAIVLLLGCAYLTKLFTKDDASKGYDTKGITWIRSVYAFGPEASQLINPASTTISNDGTSFWVTDQHRFRIVEFNWNGSFKSLFSKDASGNALNFPSDIAMAPDGWMYVCEQTYHHVAVYDPQHNRRQLLEVPNPMAIDVNDEMVVVGARSGFVAFDRQGKLIGSVGQRGNTDDSFDTINGVALDDDSNAYIVDTYNNRLSKYDRNGDRLWMVPLGPPGNKGPDVRDEDPEELRKEFPPMMQQPMGITIDGAGRLMIIDSLDFSVAGFDKTTGKYLGKWGAYGEEEGQLAYSSDIAYDPGHDFFVVTDPGNERAQIIKIPGSGGSALAGLRGNLSGPLSACCIPLLLIILLIIAYIVWQWLKKRREKQLEAWDNEAAQDIEVPNAALDFEVPAEATAKISGVDAP